MKLEHGSISIVLYVSICHIILTQIDKTNEIVEVVGWVFIVTWIDLGCFEVGTSFRGFKGGLASALAGLASLSADAQIQPRSNQQPWSNIVNLHCANAHNFRMKRSIQSLLKAAILIHFCQLDRHGVQFRAKACWDHLEQEELMDTNTPLPSNKHAYKSYLGSHARSISPKIIVWLRRSVAVT